jgi:Acetyltransferase (GNAT) family
MAAISQASPAPSLQRLARKAAGSLPRETRFSLYRRMVDCDSAPDNRLALGVASTQSDLEACFSLLHDAYVDSGFMKPDSSGLRVTPYHALPTTTTLCARFDGRVVGTLSIVRDGVFGFPMQSAFDLTSLRAQSGRIAEISALAIDPRFRNTGGSILFPLMKFMYEYCTKYFDTRHLVIAVNPKHIEMYESLLFFRRLQVQVVENYDFVNGAPAVGATLDLLEAPELFRAAYQGRRPERNLHHYFTEVSLPNICFPERPYYTTNDPVMSPALLDHFFNQRVKVFDGLDDRRRRLLHAIYRGQPYRDVLPRTDGPWSVLSPLRRHRRHSLKCPAQIALPTGAETMVALEVVNVSLHGFLARARALLPLRVPSMVNVQLGQGKVAVEQAVAVRRVEAADGQYYGFRIAMPGPTWRQCIEYLEASDALGAPEWGAACDLSPLLQEAHAAAL